MNKQWSAAALAKAYHWACMSELQALKPGNVHMFADGHGMTIQDFFKSADATAWLIAQDHIGVGQRIYLAVGKIRLKIKHHQCEAPGKV